MGKIELPYCQAVTTKGITYYYYRRGVVPRQRIQGEPGSVQFMENYTRIHLSFEDEKPIRGIIPGSFEALAQAYLKSPEYGQLGERAKAEYRSYIDVMRGSFGKLSIRTLTRNAVLKYRDSMQDKPSKANHAIKVLRLLLSFAVDREWLDRNPASGIKSLKTGEGWKAWPEAAIQNAHIKLTGSSRIAFMLALYTGQRKGDVLAMRWDAIQGGEIFVKQSKTGAELWIRIHQVLAAELKNVQRNGLAIVARLDGQPYTESGFNAVWRRQQATHDFIGLQFHGLRKNATVALFEAGCTPQEVQAITGHASLEMVQHYGKGASQRRLATGAMNKLETLSGKPIGKPKIIGGSNDC